MNFLKSLSPKQKSGLVILLIVILNLISYVFFFRLDLTRNELYTISKATRGLMGSLDDKVTVKVYFTDNLPAPYSTNRRYLEDQLEELRSYSDGKLNFQMIDPAGSPELEKQVESAQIPELQIQVIDNDKMEAKKAYMGLEILYEDKKETLPVLQQLENFEFEFATTLNRMVNKKLPVLATSADFGMQGWEGKKSIQQYLEKQFRLETISISEEAGIPDSISSLILFTPTENLSDFAKTNIKSYLNRGGKLAWLFDRVSVNIQNQQATGLNNGLDSLFSEFGITISDNLVLDLQCAAISVPQQVGMFQFNNQVQYPFLPVISAVNPESELSRGISVVTPIFASEISVGKVPDSLVVTSVLTTSEKSKRASGFYVLDPFQEWAEPTFIEKNLSIAVTVEGKFGKNAKNGRLFLMTDGEVVNDDFIQNGASIPFFMNVLYFISDDKGLLAIPSKKDFMVPLPEMAPAAKQSVKYTNLILPPVLILIWGIVRWRNRKRASESN
ncbi:MAG: GldG family protein [Bacteroidetes bacterium]|nr:GldG family protein [Bacteroidota bacterium]